MRLPTPSLKTAILGVGLIGGSMGLRLREQGWPVTGWSPREETLKLAMARGAISHAAASPEEAVEGAELIVVASPIRALPDMFRAIAGAAKRGAIVTDVASVKAQVMRWAAELLADHVRFVGGHPMAGKEVQGIVGADAELLEGATYCLVPGSREALPALEAMVEALGARPLVIAAEDHDRAVAAASHLPFVAAAALVRAVAADLDDLAGAVASSGFRDTTRVAMASPTMHADICNFNADALSAAIDRLQAELERLKRELRDPNVEQTFAEAAAVRQRWTKTRAGRRANDKRRSELRLIGGDSHE
ncbi:MAG TPA: prephenate dehydrogenase/arogenate dehydrogenase family protein [Chloroflexota bacterium]|nr:prephenate dehydrogenase/arogenate dehydrogenase family protein [Chloroflexota bacterium]